MNKRQYDKNRKKEILTGKTINKIFAPEINWPEVFPVRVEPSKDDQQFQVGVSVDGGKQLNASRWLNRITAGAAFVALLGLTFLNQQVGQMKTQSNVMKGQLTEMQTERRLSVRPWVGLDDAPDALQTSTLEFDNQGNAHIGFAFTTKNYSAVGAQNVVANGHLVIASDGAVVQKETDENCGNNYVGNPAIGEVLFPGRMRSVDSSQDVYFRQQMTSSSANAKFEAWIVGCIGYRDQFGWLYKTQFQYWLTDADPKKKYHSPVTFDIPPKAPLVGTWSEYFGSMTSGEPTS
jgi:hypothetical protein